ncbi:alpha/beta hydrolase [Breoghania sp.]|uniref:alpha/beta fold hydrolase n=1 Tax=Breoghania sp. TaxID=2065378 RepID=UPI0029C9D532|nr:alpha/beta hydrolase [Breoghania sp.]
MPAFSSDVVRRPDRHRSMTLADNRKLAWYEWGPQDGTPLLFFTGAGMAGTLGFGVEHLERLSIRLIAPDRPGLGGSDPDPAKTLTTVAMDMAALLDELAIDKIAVAAFSQGAPFSMALANLGRVERLAITAGQDDLNTLCLFEALPDEVSHMVVHAGRDPSGLATWLEGFADADGLFDLILSMSAPTDREIYRADPFATAYRTALHEGFAQGPEGYALDTAAAMSPWPFDPADIDCPVTLWYGELDTSPVHSPDKGTTLAGRLPDAERRLLADEGSALLWSRSEQILRDLMTVNA